ncbi:uncharacterized protein SPAPADRAFT_141718, partial [Spathaspora passalidarum NRRL Y-27907]
MDPQESLPHIENDRFRVPVRMLTNNQETLALLDSGAGMNFVSAAVMKRMPEVVRYTASVNVTPAFGPHKKATELVRLKFAANGATFDDWFVVLPQYKENLVLGLPFLRKHEDLISFRNNTFAGISVDNPIGLVDSNEFLRELQSSRDIGLMYLRFDREDTAAKDPNNVLPQDASGSFQDLIAAHSSIFAQELTGPPPSRGK